MHNVFLGQSVAHWQSPHFKSFDISSFDQSRLWLSTVNGYAFIHNTDIWLRKPVRLLLVLLVLRVKV